MLASIYPVLFLVLLGATALWYYSESHQLSKKIPKLLFLGAALLYIPTVFFVPSAFMYKAFLVVPRDIFMFLGVVFVTNRLAENKTRFFIATSVFIAFISLFYYNILKNTFVFNSDVAPNAELFFDIKSHSDLAQIKSELAEYDLEIKRAFPNLEHPEYSDLDEYYTVDIPSNYVYELEGIMKTLEETNKIDWVERNEIVSLSPIETEAKIVTSDKNIDYGIDDPSLAKLWGFEQMQMANYYKYLKKNNIKPKKKAKIAILDTGVDGNHEDISGNFISTKKKYNSDVQGHGTHCAGIAASVSNNKIGIASIVPNNNFVEVTSIKVLSDAGSGTQKGIIDGMILAADQGADVLSMSLGGRTGNRIQKAYDEAIKYVNKSGGIVVVAAGNSNENAKYHSPASSKGAIVVTAVDENLKRAVFSNHIEDVKMGIAAPGVNIYSTFPNDKYAVLNGTSMATPYVAGLLGMMKAVNPKLTTKEAYQLLKSTGVKTGDTKMTGKFIQPLNVLKAISKK